MEVKEFEKSQKEYLKDVPTCFLVEELAKREGVKEFIIGPDGDAHQIMSSRYDKEEDVTKITVQEQISGPARILVVIE